MTFTASNLAGASHQSVARLTRRRATTSATGSTLPAAQRQDFQQGRGFLSLLERGHILQDRFGFSVLGDDRRLAPLSKVCQDLGGVGLEVADRLA